MLLTEEIVIINLLLCDGQVLKESKLLFTVKEKKT